MQIDMFSKSTIAERARNAVLAQVKDNSEEWFPLAVAQFKNLASNPVFRQCHEKFIGEDIRIWLTVYVGKPHGPNAWGALTSNLIREGLIKETGVWKKMQEEKSHARRSPEYTWS